MKLCGALPFGALFLAAGLLAAEPLATAQTQLPKAEPGETRATLYAFFATWCVPCRVELPHIQRFYETYSRRGLKVVVVSEDAPSSAQNIPAYLARFGVTAPWVLDSESQLLERYNPAANLPFTAIVDPFGKIVYAHSGYEPGDERLLEDAIIEALTRPRKKPKIPLQVTSTTLGLGEYGQTDLGADGQRHTSTTTSIEATAVAERDHSVSMRIDGTVLTDDAAFENLDARVERMQMSALFGSTRFTAGDDYVSFGHGMSLSLRRIDPLGLDTALRGGRVDVDYGRYSVTTLFGWTNRQNYDPIARRILENKGDLMAGGEVTYSWDKGSEAGPYALFVHSNDAAPDGGDISWALAGAATSLALGPVRVAADAAGGVRRSAGGMVEGDDQDEKAWASYGSVQWTGGRLTALVDAKAYRHWAIGREADTLLYHEPPTLERADQEVPGNEDALGARTRVEWRARENATVFANLLGYRYSNDDTTNPIDGDLAVHGYAGGEMRFGLDDDASVALEAGYRREHNSEGDRKLAFWHVDLDGALRLPGNLAVTVKWNFRDEVKRASISDNEFIRSLAVLGLSKTGWGTLSFLYGYSSERRAVDPVQYPGGEFLVHLPRGGNVRLFVGRLLGGRVCVSGTCRDVPSFEGARLDLTIRI